MNSQQIETHLTDFKVNLQHKLAKNISLGCLGFFAVFAFMKLVTGVVLINMRTQSEYSYLLDIGQQLILSEQIEVNRGLSFLDGTHSLITNTKLITSGNSTCNSTYFDCTLSSTTNYTPYGSIYPLIAANSQLLWLSSTPLVLFLYQNTQAVYLNQATLGISPASINTTIISNFMIKNPSDLASNAQLSTHYIMNQAMLGSTSSYQFLCQHVGSTGLVLCVVLVKTVAGVLPGKQNQLYSLSQFPKISTGFIQISILQWSSTVSTLNTNSLSQCLTTRNSQLSQYINPSIGVPGECVENFAVFQGLFTTSFPYTYFQMKVSPLLAATRWSASLTPTPYTVSFYISSNQTYQLQIEGIIQPNGNQLRHTGYVLILVLVIALFLLNISVDAIESTLISSIVLVRNMGDHLKNKEEKQFNQLTKKPQLFSFLVSYFNKFMWIHKLLKFKSKSRYKKLLLEGIELFGQQNSSVQEFIFRQLIAIEGDLVQKYLKINQLPTKKKTTRKKSQFRITGRFNEGEREKTRRRKFTNQNLLDPDNQLLMKNISVGLRTNRGVRFSNDIQTLQIDEGPVLRRSKFSQISGLTCKTIQNQLSESNLGSNVESLKSQVKSQKQDDSSEDVSLNDLNRSRKKESSLVKSRGFESVHFDLNNLRLDEELSDEGGQVQLDVTEEEEIYQMGTSAITEQTTQSYHRIIKYYQELIVLKNKAINHQDQDALYQDISAIYQLTLQKYVWWGELLAFENQMNLMKDEEERQDVSEFQDITSLEQSYNHYIKYQLMQRGQVVRLKIHQALELPVPFKSLQYLAKSAQKAIRVTARYLIATMAQQLTPHLDEVVFKNIIHALLQQQTSNTVKRKLLSTLTKTLQLQRYGQYFREEIPELKLVHQFYNTKNKKIYFLSSLPNPKPYHKLLGRFFELIHPFDVVCVFNLDEENVDSNQEQISEAHSNNHKGRRCNYERVKFLLDLEDFTDIFNFSDKMRESLSDKPISNSSRTINKKRVYEKEFHQILTTIENDKSQFSKYIVVLLGQEHGSYSGETEQSSSTGHHRPYQQRIHQEITKIIDRGYQHYILTGHQLGAYPSKYGRLKKYLKLAPDLLQLDLSDKYQEENFYQLQKYLK